MAEKIETPIVYALVVHFALVFQGEFTQRTRVTDLLKINAKF